MAAVEKPGKRRRPPRSAPLLERFAGLSSCQLIDAAPLPTLLVDCETPEQEKAIEEEEREQQWAWEERLCAQVRDGEVSIESAVRAASMYGYKRGHDSMARFARRIRRGTL